MVIGVDTSCIYCGTPMHSCVLPVVCWKYLSLEEVMKREDEAKKYREWLREESFKECLEYQI